MGGFISHIKDNINVCNEISKENSSENNNVIEEQISPVILNREEYVERICRDIVANLEEFVEINESLKELS